MHRCHPVCSATEPKTARTSAAPANPPLPFCISRPSLVTRWKRQRGTLGVVLQALWCLCAQSALCVMVCGAASCSCSRKPRMAGCVFMLFPPRDASCTVCHPRSTGVVWQQQQQQFVILQSCGVLLGCDHCAAEVTPALLSLHSWAALCLYGALRGVGVDGLDTVARLPLRGAGIWACQAIMQPLGCAATHFCCDWHTLPWCLVRSFALLRGATQQHELPASILCKHIQQHHARLQQALAFHPVLDSRQQARISRQLAESSGGFRRQLWWACHQQQQQLLVFCQAAWPVFHLLLQLLRQGRCELLFRCCRCTNAAASASVTAAAAAAGVTAASRHGSCVIAADIICCQRQGLERCDQVRVLALCCLHQQACTQRVFKVTQPECSTLQTGATGKQTGTTAAAQAGDNVSRVAVSCTNFFDQLCSRALAIPQAEPQHTAAALPVPSCIVVPSHSSARTFPLTFQAPQRPPDPPNCLPPAQTHTEP